MKEGRQTEAGEQDAQRRSNVVRLPRDWLGPREELVPFGPRRAESEAPDPPATATSLDAPPSADDFWGERSAAIHGALQAPESWAERGSLRPSGSTRSDGHVTERRSVRARAVRLPRADRRAVAVALAALAAAAVTFVVVVPAFRRRRTPRRCRRIEGRRGGRVQRWDLRDLAARARSVRSGP